MVPIVPFDVVLIGHLSTTMTRSTKLLNVVLLKKLLINKQFVILVFYVCVFMSSKANENVIQMNIYEQNGQL